MHRTSNNMYKTLVELLRHTAPSIVKMLPRIFQKNSINVRTTVVEKMCANVSSDRVVDNSLLYSLCLTFVAFDAFNSFANRCGGKYVCPTHIKMKIAIITYHYSEGHKFKFRSLYV